MTRLAPGLVAVCLFYLGSVMPGWARSPFENLSLEQALQLALERNHSLLGSRMDVALAQSRWRAQRDVYSPTLSLMTTEALERAGGAPEGAPATVQADSEEIGLQATMEQGLPTGGHVSLNGEMGYLDPDLSEDDAYDSLIFLKLSQPLLRGAGKRITEAELRRAENSVRRQEMEQDLSAQMLILEVVTAYNELLQSDLLVKVGERTLEQAESLLQAAQVRFEVGDVAEIDVLRGRFQVKESQSKVSDAKRYRSVACTRLLALLGEENMEQVVSVPAPEGASVQSALKAEEMDLNQSIDRALSQRLELKQLEMDLRNSQLDRVIAQDALKDDIEAFGSYGYADRDTRFEESLTLSGPEWGVGLEMTLSRALPSQREALVQAEIGIQKTLNALEEQRIQVVREVRESTASLTAAWEKLGILRESLALAQETFELTRQSYLEGLISSFDLLQAQNDLTRTETDTLRAMIDYRIQVVSHQKATGDLKVPWPSGT